MAQLIVASGALRTPISTDTSDKLDLVHLGDSNYHLVHQHKTYHCSLLNIDLPTKKLTVNVNGQNFDLSIEDEIDTLIRELGLGVVETAASKDVFAPMPGLVLDVLVAVGDAVESGDKLLVLEAMKMENSLTADGAGTVTSIAVSKGDAVEKRQLLIEVA